VLMRIYDHTGGVNPAEHRFGRAGGPREAFGFYANSVLRLASGTRNTAIERGQYLEWEGLVDDVSQTRLRVTEPTGDRDVFLPDRSGYVALTASPAGHLDAGEVVLDPPDLPPGTTVEIAVPAEDLDPRSACACSPRRLLADPLLLKSCAVGDDGTLRLRVLNLSTAPLPDASTPPVSVDYGCIAR
jgi:hypothetical protein